MHVDGHAQLIVIHLLSILYPTNITCYINSNQHELVCIIDKVFSFSQLHPNKSMKTFTHPHLHLLILALLSYLYL